MLNKSEDAWTTHDTAELYRLERWSDGFFFIDAGGFLVADLGPRSNPSQAKRIRVVDVVNKAREQGLTPPLLIRFPDIIKRRTEQINHAFQSAIAEYGYQSTYRCFYPIKVNQHFEVVQKVIACGRTFDGGVEAGSKAELLSVIALTDDQTPILCNGFKDATVIEMAIRATQIGRQVTIILEKPNELSMVLECARKLGARPQLGIRVKLAARTGGHWHSSGGSKSKFGFTVPQLTDAVERLREEGFLDRVNLLHFHPGSQISNVRKIKSALIEVARIYVDLVARGVPLEAIDVGGGLAVDYTGNRNKDPSSMNYTLEEYANDVVYYIQQICDQTQTRHPMIISESGRALVAHHSMLVVPIIGTAQSDAISFRIPATEELSSDSPPIVELKQICDELNQQNLLESFHDAQDAMEMTLQMFAAGTLDMDQRAIAERLVWAICTRVNELIDELEFVPGELKNLSNTLADTYFGNFSVFQALPDSWALNQLFPVMPIHRLAEKPSRHGVLGDITCDSDGKVDCFVSGGGERSWLPLHELNDVPYYLGIFLVGAYQEALSDDHNLMGKFHTITVESDQQTAGPDAESAGSFEIEVVAGSNLRDVLQHVRHDWTRLERSVLGSIDQALRSRPMDAATAQQIKDFFSAAADQYTYLQEENRPATTIPAWHGQGEQAKKAASAVSPR